MITVLPADKVICSLLRQSGRGDGPRKWTSFQLRTEAEGGLLLLNTLTLGLLWLSPAEAAQLDTPQGALREALEAGWYLIPAGLDEHSVARELRELRRLMDPPKSWLQKYTVFTTTACNARCAYCFERSWEPRTMTPETAERAADYMLAHSGSHNFQIDWFGGEPLVNRRAIDCICDRLTQGGARFHSAMTSNGYLFEPKTVAEDRACWRLNSCQITLDGPEETYNRIKNYVYPGGNAFRRVLDNIHALAQAGVQVFLRLNFDLSNASEQHQLIDVLAAEFGGHPMVSAYAMMLYDEAEGEESHTPPAERVQLFALRQELTAHIQAGGLRQPLRLLRELRTHMCMADSGDMITILPGGEIGLCEQYHRDHFIGHIEREGFDRSVMDEFCALRPEIPACADCPLYPDCIRLQKCPNQLCSPERRAAQEAQQRGAMQVEWENYRRKHPLP